MDEQDLSMDVEPPEGAEENAAQPAAAGGSAQPPPPSGTVQPTCTLSTGYQLFEDLLGDNSTCSKPPVNFKTKVPFWPGLAWPGQAKAERVLKSTGGFERVELSPYKD